MTDFRPIFTQLGLQQYIDTFADEGFETWETILEITESDLDALRVKLGHRRILQREIASARGLRIEPPNLSTPVFKSQSSQDSVQYTTDVGNDAQVSEPGTAPRKKRRYRRHPKPDENAPERPPSAYVVFSNKVRDDLKPLSLSFTEIAKRVGESWQLLSSPEKEPYERAASAAKERYHKEMVEYKTTEMYREYQRYMADFKVKHGSHTEEARPRLEHQTSTPSNTSGGSGNENTAVPLGALDFPRSRLEAAPSIASASVSRPSSTHSMSPAKDLSLSVSPAGHSFAMGSPSGPRATLSEGYVERALPPKAAQHMTHQSIPYEPSSPSSSATATPHNASRAHARRNPLWSPEQVPSFGHEDSSRSSIISSQSSITTAATAMSTPRGSEDSGKQHIILPPLSTVTGLTRDTQGIDQSGPFKDDPSSLQSASLSYSMNPPLAPAFSASTSVREPSFRKDMQHQPSGADAEAKLSSSRHPLHIVPMHQAQRASNTMEAPSRTNALSVLADAADTGLERLRTPARP